MKPYIRFKLMSSLLNVFSTLVLAGLILLSGTSLHAARIKDLTLIEGGRDNQLVGYGIVVGLSGDGDSNSNGTLHVVANILQRYGITVSIQDLKSKNLAAVMVTADIGPFIKPGARIDVTVASLGDAKSLQGGILLQTPLLAADGVAYAVSQGPVAIGGFIGGTGGPGGATVQKNHPTVGAISNGAIVERAINAQFVHEERLRLLLESPDFNTAARMADAINREWPNSALAVDSATVQVGLPPMYHNRQVSFIADMGMLDMDPDSMARIVINERTGTIVATSTVRISEVAIAHGNLTITVASNVGVSQPNSFTTGGQSTPVNSTQTNVTEQRGGFSILNTQPPTIERLAAALNAFGVSTRDMMAIFQTLKRAGALQAELIIN
jgi:flagellar P-ring protein precursor FlgI